MRRLWLFGLIGLLAVSGSARADAFGSDWPAGPNRELTGAFCGSCHALALVSQQRFDRPGWDALLDWMIKTQNMPNIDRSVRELMLDYLVHSYGRETGGPQAPDALLNSPGGLQGIILPPLLPTPQNESG